MLRGRATVRHAIPRLEPRLSGSYRLAGDSPSTAGQG